MSKSIKDTLSEAIKGVAKLGDKLTPTCKGLIFKCEVSIYDKVGMVLYNTIKMRMLKRQSCPGCKSCWGIYEDLHDTGSENIRFPLEPIDKGIYQPTS